MTFGRLMRIIKGHHVLLMTGIIALPAILVRMTMPEDCAVDYEPHSTAVYVMLVCRWIISLSCLSVTGYWGLLVARGIQIPRWLFPVFIGYLLFFMGCGLAFMAKAMTNPVVYCPTDLVLLMASACFAPMMTFGTVVVGEGALLLTRSIAGLDIWRALFEETSPSRALQVLRRASEEMEWNQ